MAHSDKPIGAASTRGRWTDSGLLGSESGYLQGAGTALRISSDHAS